MLDCGSGLEGAVLGGGFGDWNDKIRSGWVQPDRPAPSEDEIADVLRPMCRAWGYLWRRHRLEHARCGEPGGGEGLLDGLGDGPDVGRLGRHDRRASNECRARFSGGRRAFRAGEGLALLLVAESRGRDQCAEART